MPTYFRDEIYSPLSPDEAKELVEELLALMEESFPEDEEEKQADGEWDDDEVAQLYDSLEMEVDESPPPTAEQALERARATGHVERSFEFEPAAMKLLPECRSMIALRYPSGTTEAPSFVAILKRLFARTGPGTVVGGETSYMTAATYAAGFGPAWGETPAAKTRAEREAEELARRRAAKPKVKQRDAKPGEVEALAIHEKLTRMFERGDPMVRSGLRRALEKTTEVVRQYAAALMELGPKADVTIGKAIGQKPPEVAEAREVLEDLLDDLDED